MPGYFKNATATAETLVDDWCHTGDIGYYDSQGRVFIEDRKKELIKVKGLQVAPAELENTIRSMEGVVDVAVIGSVLSMANNKYQLLFSPQESPMKGPARFQEPTW